MYIPTIPEPRAVPPSEIVYVPVEAAPVPKHWSPPAKPKKSPKSPTALRAWNGADDANRAFDQTQIQLTPADDGSASWQFYWKTKSKNSEAVRWEIATVPFVNDIKTFPPMGLVAYGDASVDAKLPLKENFFAIDFVQFKKAADDGTVPRIFYMRVVPVNGDGESVSAASNFIRVDLP